MRIYLTLADGRKLQYGGRSRYVAFRLTHVGGFSVSSGNLAETTVRFARDKWRERGFAYLVVDTTTGQAIGVYPYTEKNLPDGHPPIHKSCQECGGGWSRVPTNEGYAEWVPDHDLLCSEFE